MKALFLLLLFLVLCACAAPPKPAPVDEVGVAPAATVRLDGVTTNSCVWSRAVPSGATLVFTCVRPR